MPAPTTIAFTVFFLLSGLWLSVMATDALRTGVTQGVFGEVRRASTSNQFWAIVILVALFSAWCLVNATFYIESTIGRVR